MYYTCVICNALNHASRLHCSACGTTPAKYSILAVPTDYERFTPVVRAHGAMLQLQLTSRVFFRTVEPTYYAEV